MAVAAVPFGVFAWPDRDDELTAREPPPVLHQPERKLPVSRSSARVPIDPSMLPQTLVALEPARTRTPGPALTLTTTPRPEAIKTPDQTSPVEETPTPTRTLPPTPESTVVGHRYATVNLNVRAGPDLDAEVLTVLAAGTEVDITGTTEGSWVQIVYDGAAAWVSGEYLSKTEPTVEAESDSADDETAGISYAECESGSEVAEGLTPDAIRVHRAVCAEFPEVTSYGGVRSGGGAHGEGRALDIMVSSSSLGDAIAAWVREHYEELGVSEVIWAQHIWTVQRGSEGWRWMEDRGSDTANHYDHVHVTVYGDAGE